MKLTFKNNSIFDVVSPLNSTRGGRRNAGIIDEFRQNILKISEKVEFLIRKTHLLLER